MIHRSRGGQIRVSPQDGTVTTIYSHNYYIGGGGGGGDTTVHGYIRLWILCEISIEKDPISGMDCYLRKALHDLKKKTFIHAVNVDAIV